MGNFYYEAVYDLLRGPKDFKEKAVELKRLKEKNPTS
jgi:hypothetical protein